MDEDAHSPLGEHRESAGKFVFEMLSHLIHLHRAFITLDRVIIHGITVGREGMQIHKLFYSVAGTSDLPNITSLTTCSMTQSESLAEQLIDSEDMLSLLNIISMISDCFQVSSNLGSTVM